MSTAKWFSKVIAILLVSIAAAAPAQTDESAAESVESKESTEKGLPLKPERTIEFTTDEGSWVSLDVSRDGSKILFELLGDLYELPISGGQAQPLLTGMAMETTPSYSPDGKRFAFVSDRDGAENLWIADADGANPKQLSKEKQGGFTSPAWTPDGEYVIVSRIRDLLGVHELWMYHVAGGSGIQLTRATEDRDAPRSRQRNALGAVASPDGKFIYYTRRNGSWTYDVPGFPLWQIMRRDRDTGEEDQITDEPMGAFRPELSPNGKLMVYATRFETETGLRLRNLETGEERWLKYPVQRDDQESRASRDVLPSYSFAPDGKSIVVAYGGKIHRVEVANGNDQVIPFEAAVKQELGPLLDFPTRVEDGPVRARLIMSPAQAPNAQRIAFSTFGKLYTAGFSGEAPRRLTNSDVGEFQPSWSPDGSQLVYVTWSNDGGGHIWRVSAAGGAPQRLTTVAAYYRDPVWTPDGARIVALRAPVRSRLLSGRGGSVAGSELIYLPAGGGDATLIAPARGAGQPHFGPELDRIYLYSNSGLLSMRFDGTDRRAHLKVPAKPVWQTSGSADDARISPDGTKALALIDYHLYILHVPKVGGEAQEVDVYKPSVPVKKLTDVGADYFGWADGGRTVTWAVGASFFRQPLDSIAFESEEPDEEDDAPAEQTARRNPAVEEYAFVVERPRHRTAGRVLLRGATVITMRGDEVLQNADVLVEDGRIRSVGPRSPQGSQGVEVLDVSGTVIMPGIIDVHAHWRTGGDVLDTQEWSLLANFAYGVTSGRDPQTGAQGTFAYQDLIDAGEMIGPRAYSTGRGVFINSNLQSIEEAKNLLSRYGKYYRTNTIKSYLVGNRKQRQWVVEASKENSIMPTTEGGLDLKLDLTHVMDGFSGNEHSFPIVPLYKDVVELTARSGLTYTPTLLVAFGGPRAEHYFYETTEVYDDPKLRRFIPQHELYDKASRRPWFREEEHVFPRIAEAAAKIVRAGGRVGIGGHGQLQGIQCHWEMWALQSGGLSNHETLRAATLHGAEAIGLAQDLGSIEEGKLADLVVLNANPLEDIRNTIKIRYVMKDGELFEAGTLDQIWPTKKIQPAPWWSKDLPRDTAGAR